MWQIVIAGCRLHYCSYSNALEAGIKSISEDALSNYPTNGRSKVYRKKNLCMG
jgi:hypothetical protein